MFHEITDQELRQRKKRRIVAGICVALLVLAVCGIGFIVRQNAREQGAAALRESILASAKQCCAIEGSYPRSLEHLEEDYGLTINHNDYVVSYEYFAGNVMPSVVVTPR